MKEAKRPVAKRENIKNEIEVTEARERETGREWERGLPKKDIPRSFQDEVVGSFFDDENYEPKL